MIKWVNDFEKGKIKILHVFGQLMNGLYSVFRISTLSAIPQYNWPWYYESHSAYPLEWFDSHHEKGPQAWLNIDKIAADQWLGTNYSIHEL